MSSERAVRIRNAIGGCGFTSARRAIQYLKRGQARVTGEHEIEFIATDFRCLSAERSMQATTEPARVPTRGPALLVVAAYGDWSPRTFAPYPIQWEGYTKAA